MLISVESLRQLEELLLSGVSLAVIIFSGYLAIIIIKKIWEE